MNVLKPVPLAFLSLLMAVGGCRPAPVPPAKRNVQYMTAEDGLTYHRIGKEVVDSVGGLLKAQLMQALADGGPGYALHFCSHRALTLTASYSQRYHTSVRRTSDRLRNPANEPDGLEADVIADYRQEQQDGRPLLPKVAIAADGRKHFFAPIITGAMCLACHGHEANMDDSLKQVITGLYPDDRATGFAIDELRGVWSVAFLNL